MAYRISCCSTVDMNEKWVKEHELSVAYFHYFVGGTEYRDDFFQSMTPKELYERMLAGEETRTSQVNVGEYEELFRSILKEGEDVLHVSLSSGISGTVNSACIAQEMLKEEFPERKIYVVDSLQASAGYALFVDRLCEERDRGMEIDELYREALELRKRVHAWFFSSDLTFLIRGGRVSRAAGIVGSLLRICPMLHIPMDGTLQPVEKIRGKKRALERQLELLMEYNEQGENYAEKCYICHSEREEDAEYLRSRILERCKKVKEVTISPIGTVIGCHTGPGTVGLFFFGRSREK